MPFSDYTLIHPTQDHLTFLAKNAQGQSFLIRRYTTLPSDQTLLDNPPKGLLVPKEVGKIEGEKEAQFYRVYPYLETLEAFLEKHPFSLIQKKQIAYAIAETLQSAHQKEILHGHLSPKSILIDPHLQPYLFDFSLPRLEQGNLDSVSDGLQDLPYCLDPEQANGMPPSQKGDYYSLGAVYYFLLSGRYPFPQDNPLELLHCHLYETPRSLEQYEGPFIFRELVFQLLDKDPSLRPNLFKTLETISLVPEETQPLPILPKKKSNPLLRVVLLLIGLLLLLAIPKVRLFLQHGNLGSVYSTRGRVVQIELQNGKILHGTLIDNPSHADSSWIYFREHNGPTYTFRAEEIRKMTYPPETSGSK